MAVEKVELLRDAFDLWVLFYEAEVVREGVEAAGRGEASGGGRWV